MAALIGYVISLLAHADELATRWATTMSPEGLAKAISEGSDEVVGRGDPINPARGRSAGVRLLQGIGCGAVVVLIVLTRKKRRK